MQGELIDENNPEIKLIATVIKLIKSCFESTPDESIRTQILNAYQTAILSPVCGVHEESIISAFGICLNIFLLTKSDQNRTIAKNALLKILTVTFKRMEIREDVNLILKGKIVAKINQEIFSKVESEILKQKTANNSQNNPINKQIELNNELNNSGNFQINKNWKRKTILKKEQ